MELGEWRQAEPEHIVPIGESKSALTFAISRWDTFISRATSAAPASYRISGSWTVTVN